VFTVNLNIIQTNVRPSVPWIRWPVAGLSLWKPGFNSRSVHVMFVVNRLALGRDFLRVYAFPLSGSFHECSVLIFIYMLLYDKGKWAKPRDLHMKHWTAK